MRFVDRAVILETPASFLSGDNQPTSSISPAFDGNLTDLLGLDEISFCGQVYNHEMDVTDKIGWIFSYATMESLNNVRFAVGIKNGIIMIMVGSVSEEFEVNT